MRYEDLIKAYKDNLRAKNYATRSIEHYEEGLKAFIEFIVNEKGIGRPQDIKKAHIMEYQNRVHGLRRKLDGKPLSLGRKAHLLLSVKSFFKYLSISGEIIYNPSCGIDLPLIRNTKAREVLTIKEINKLLKSIKGRTLPLETRDRAMLELLYSTGMRNTELRDLTAEDIDLEREEVKIKKGKGGKWRVLPLGRVAAGYIEEYIINARPILLKNKNTPDLFINFMGGRLSRRSLSDIAGRHARRAGIKKRVRAHTIRHTCATHLLKGGADIRYVQELLGHGSLDTTQIYTKVEISDLKKAHRRSHPREKL